MPIRVSQLSGVFASLRWGYHPAATLNAWTVTRVDDQAWSLTATVVSSDAFRVSQRPLALEAPHEKGLWKWPITELQITGASLTATLGLMENR